MISWIKNHAEKIIATVGILAILTHIGPNLYEKFTQSDEGDVLQATYPKTGDVEVTARVYSCVLKFIVLPEKRIPATGNWPNQVNFEIYDDANNLAAKFDATTPSSGLGEVNLCDLGIYLEPGDYTTYIRGLSHLRKNFGEDEMFRFFETNNDFSNGGTELLLAGETSNVYNNYINTLDISTQIANMETSDVKNDLNRDGEVNTLDISNTIYNFYISGDCSPEEEANNICID